MYICLYKIWNQSVWCLENLFNICKSESSSVKRMINHYICKHYESEYEVHINGYAYV